jgi:hypothetical protein
MPENTNQPFSPDYSSELDIESIISAPLVAASKANVVMVTGQTRFLLEYCFQQKDDGNYEPKMINMVMKQGVPDPTKKPGDPAYIQEAKMTFTIPLLCLVPLNSLAIDKVTVDFDLEITSMTSRDVKTEITGSTGDENQKRNIIDKKVQLNGMISYKHNNTCNETYKNQSTSRLAVNINAGPLPLPVGVLTILDLYTKTIQPLPQAANQK